MKKPFVLLWVLFGGVILFSWVYLPTLSKYHDLKPQQEELDAQVEKLTADVQAMREERDLLKNDVEYLEKVIRGELGLVKPGEIVYKFVKNKPVTAVEAKKSETAKPAAVPTSAPKPAPVPAGETFAAKPVTAPKSKVAVVTAGKPKTALAKKPAPASKPKTTAAAPKPL